MDPNYRRDKPGKSPMGMDLVPVYDEDLAERDEPGTVRISPSVINTLGIRTATAQSGTLHRLIESVGYVQYDEDMVVHVHTRVEGWIEGLQVRAAGDPVGNGQVLFTLYSPPLVNAQEEYLAAQASGSQTLLRASRERLLAFGLTESQIDALHKTGTAKQRIAIYAPSGGYLAELKVREGMYITPASEVMTIADLSSVWVIGEVFERQAGWVAPGQRVEIRLDAMPGRVWEGEVDYIYPELDPDTRTLRIRVRLPNPGSDIKPNMYVRLVIHGAETGETVNVPREALIRGGRVDRLVLATGEGRFKAVPVQAGIESGDRVQILEGIKAGDEVVVSGQFLIDSESNIDAEILRGSANKPMNGSPAEQQHVHDNSGSEMPQ
jgi:Cu(I)/Ag(I) efflux system membrane fusion protein